VTATARYHLAGNVKSTHRQGSCRSFIKKSDFGTNRPASYDSSRVGCRQWGSASRIVQWWQMRSKM